MHSLDLRFLVLVYLTTVLWAAFGYIIAGVLGRTGIARLMGTKTIFMRRIGVSPALTHVPALYLVSPRAAHANISELLKEGKIEPIDIYVVTLATEPFIRLYYAYRYYLPVLLPLWGVMALYFIALRMPWDFLLMGVAVAVGRRRYRSKRCRSSVRVRVDLSKRTIAEGILRGLRCFLDFGVKFTLAFLVVTAMMEVNVDEEIALFLKPFLMKAGLDSMQVTYLVTAMLSPRVAYGLAKLMLDIGYPVMKVLCCVFLGNGLYMLLMEWWRYGLPFYTSLYPKDVALKLLLLRYGLSSFYVILVGVLLMIL